MTPLCKSAILVVLLHFFTAVSVLIRAPSVFRSDEADMHKYSAILAATEPFRIQCEEQIKRSANPIKFLAKRILGTLLTVIRTKALHLEHHYRENATRSRRRGKRGECRNRCRINSF